jgi:hypothetical protein
VEGLGCGKGWESEGRGGKGKEVKGEGDGWFSGLGLKEVAAHKEPARKVGEVGRGTRERPVRDP